MTKRDSRNLENALEPGADSNFSEIRRLGSGEKSPKKKQKFLTISGGDLLEDDEEKLPVLSNRVKSCSLSRVKDGKPAKAETENEPKTPKSKVDFTKVAKAAKTKGAKAVRSKRAAKGRETRKTGKPPVVFPELENKPASGMFTPTEKERRKMLAVFSKGGASKERKALVAKLAAEFTRQYSRWRKVNDSWFKLHDKERRYSEEIAVLCIEREVTPSRLFKYWAANIERFHLRYPTLPFLSSPGNVDAAASFFALNGPDANPATFAKKRDKTNEAAGLHGYADTTQLHGQLRSTLERGGFDVSGWSDRDLMSVQNAAKGIAAGRRLFVSSTMRPMVDRALRLFTKAGK
jgi:hypothetical protein